MGYIDLHVHSNASDGTLSPTEVVSYARSKQLDAIALTDHDTVSGIAEALAAAAPSGPEVIPGIELSCIYRKKEIHILGLFLDYQNPELLKQLEQLQEIRQQRNDEMLIRFNQADIVITKQELQDANPDTVITRAHFAKVLTAKGYASSMNQAFHKFLQYGGDYCVRKEQITPEHVMKLLQMAQAFPVLAHPLQYKLGYPEIKQLVSYLKPLGLSGLEVYHSSNNQNESRHLKEIAKSYQLLPTGGSDFHGANKPDIDLGCGRGGLRLSHLLLDDIKASLSCPHPSTSPAPSQNT